jgi:hypothetical protein
MNSKLYHNYAKYQTERNDNGTLANFCCILYLLESVNVRLFHTTETCSWFDLDHSRDITPVLILYEH